MANPPPPKMPPKPKPPMPAWRLKVGKAIPWLLAATVGALLLQVYLAGAGLLGADHILETHSLFANAVVRLLFTLLLLVGFVGADWRIGVVGLALTVLLELQYGLIEAGDGGVRGLHAANGAIMILISAVALMRRLPWAPLGPARSSA